MIRTVREAGATAMPLVRADSAFLSAKVVGAICAADALFSITEPRSSLQARDERFAQSVKRSRSAGRSARAC
ncbi:hypothetical protein ABZY09_47590 [Streptomyces sp. NPDC002928]|uniref:hypothetical protein n=1 Tax=Streptomyces sp. NPDC002928 TaxID=3154440 RepID=UPI0033A3B0DB